MKHWALALALSLLITPWGVAKNMSEIDKLWNYRQPKETRVLFLKELEAIDFKTQPQLYLELQTQLARTHSLEGNFKEAHALLDAIHSHWDTASERVKVRYFLERGRCWNSAKEEAKAIPLFKDALELAQIAKLSFYAVDAAHMLGIASPAQEQITWNEKAIQLAEESNDARTKGWLGSLYNNLAWTYHDLKAYDKALDLFEKAQGWHEEKKTVEGLLIAKWSVARAHRSLEHYALALDLQMALLKEREAKNLAADGYLYEEIAENLLALERSTEAKSYFKKAYALLSQDTWLQKHEADRLARLQSLSL